MTRQAMGPRASEPEQRTYLVERVRADGHVTERVLVRHVHALDAARSFAEDSAITGPFHEYAHAPGVWSISNADTVVRATLDTPHARASLTAAPLTFMRSSAPAPTNDERAAVQRRIADAIRFVKPEPLEAAIAAILAPGWLETMHKTGPESHAARMFAMALAAAAKCPAILDAVRQVAQVHALTDE